METVKLYVSTQFNHVKDFAVAAPVAIGVGVVAFVGVGVGIGRAIWRKAKS